MRSIVPLGDQALEIRFEAKVSPAVNDEVQFLARQIRQKIATGVRFVAPAYTSITVGFDPMQVDFQFLEDAINKIGTPKQFVQDRRRLEIPVCYAEPFGLDLAAISQRTRLSVEHIVSLHTSGSFRVYMLGFIPGFVYMGTVPEELVLERRPIPRMLVPRGSVGIAGWQTGIYPSDVPGGWHILGKTPIPLLIPGDACPSPFQVGDEVSFRSISTQEFAAIADAVGRDRFDVNALYV